MPINSSKTTPSTWRRYVTDTSDALDSRLTTAETNISNLESESLALHALNTTTSGTSTTFSSIPAGTQKVEIVFLTTKTNGGNNFRIRLGDSEGVETTNYASATSRLTGSGVTTTSSTTQIAVGRSVSGDQYSGIVTGVHVGSNVWVFSGSCADTDGSTIMATVAGHKQLSGELTTIEVSLASDNFTAGWIGLMVMA